MNTNGSRFWGVVATLGLAGMSLLFLAFVMDESRSFQVPVLPIMALVGGAVLMGMVVKGAIGQSIARMLDSRSQPDEPVTGHFDRVEAHLADLGVDQQRMAELEDRLDFAERLLAQRHDAAVLRGTERS
ncbi:MAG TPA: hypothetical protein VHW65_05760 [Gemmatimonadales bacterium]|jgi:hypothetical protein|nr:hypothetical protein [Gemmatimonadales bacterium]